MSKLYKEYWHDTCDTGEESDDHHAKEDREHSYAEGSPILGDLVVDILNDDFARSKFASGTL